MADVHRTGSLDQITFITLSDIGGLGCRGDNYSFPRIEHVNKEQGTGIINELSHRYCKTLVPAPYKT